jgi:hypothetical protein
VRYREKAEEASRLVLIVVALIRIVEYTGTI